MSSAPDFPTSAPFYIKASHSGLVLQPRANSYQATRIVQATQKFACSFTSQGSVGDAARHQLWRYDNGQLINVASGLALDYEGGSISKFSFLAGTINVCQWQVKTGQEAHNQRWLSRSGGLIAAHDDVSRVLDVRGASTEEGAEVLLYKLKKESDTGDDNQRFTFEVPLNDEQGQGRGQQVAEYGEGSFSDPAHIVSPHGHGGKVQLPGQAFSSYYDE